MMHYKGYSASVEFDEDAKLFHGEVIDLRDVITFEADCAKDLIRAFHDSVNDYLEFCAERGEAPEKPFSGNLPLRMDVNLHRKVFVAASSQGKSVNAWICLALEQAVAYGGERVAP
jgi:predicted HicB family RNase H-like nuclease